MNKPVPSHNGQDKEVFKEIGSYAALQVMAIQATLSMPEIVNNDGIFQDLLPSLMARLGQLSEVMHELFCDGE